MLSPCFFPLQSVSSFYRRSRQQQSRTLLPFIKKHLLHKLNTCFFIKFICFQLLYYYLSQILPTSTILCNIRDSIENVRLVLFKYFFYKTEYYLNLNCCFILIRSLLQLGFISWCKSITKMLLNTKSTSKVRFQYFFLFII